MFGFIHRQREQLVETLIAAGLASPHVFDCSSASVAIPKIGRLISEALARELVRQGKLTHYQAEVALSGNSDGLLLGDYVILDDLVSSGFDYIFKARHRHEPVQTVEIHVLWTSSAIGADPVVRLHHEVKDLARLSHPNLIAIYDIFGVAGKICVATELVNGIDLARFVRDRGPLSVVHALSYVLQAACGLERVHAQGLVHGNITPEHLILDDEGTVRVLNLGWAGDWDLRPQMIDYRAPERVANPLAGDLRADLYSLGATLHYLLTGRPPFSGDALRAKLEGHESLPTPILRDLRDDVPFVVEMMFQTMIAHRAEDRYPTLRDVITALDWWDAQFRAAGVAD